MNISRTIIYYVLLVAAAFISTGCDAFTTPQYYRYITGWTQEQQQQHLPQYVRGDISLSMGIRSFIKRKVLRRKDVDDDNNSSSRSGNNEEGYGNSIEKKDVTLNSILQDYSSSYSDDDTTATTTSKYDKVKSKIKDKIAIASDKITTKKSTSMDYYDDDTTIADKINKMNEQQGGEPATPSSYGEDTQQRIKRMKTGKGMTEEEKAAFLSNALTRTVPRGKPRGPPIRQDLPDVGGAAGSSGRSKDVSSGDSSNGNENLWNALTKRDASSQNKETDQPQSDGTSPLSLMMDGKMKNEDAKRRYMESITNPNRFSTFSVAASDSSAGDDSATDSEEDKEEEEASDIDANTTSDDFNQMKRQIVEDQALLDPKAGEKKEEGAARDAVESILSMISSNNDKKKQKVAESTTDDDNVDEDSTDKKAKVKDNGLAERLGKAAMEQEKKDAEARAAAAKKKEKEKQKYAELQRQRGEEAHRVETERMEKARKIGEAARKKELEADAAQRAELESRQAAQDEYWAKMLKKEQSRTETSQPIDITRKKEVMARDMEERLERDAAKDVERAKIREEERAREDPHEGEILKEVSQ